MLGKLFLLGIYMIFVRFRAVGRSFAAWTLGKDFAQKSQLSVPALAKKYVRIKGVALGLRAYRIEEIVATLLDPYFKLIYRPRRRYRRRRERVGPVVVSVSTYAALYTFFVRAARTRTLSEMRVRVR